MMNLKKFIKKILNYKNIEYFEQRFPNIKFDKQWYDEYLSHKDIRNCKLERIKLKKLICRIMLEDGKWEKLPLSKSPDYLYLISGDKKAYTEYLNIYSHTCERFEQLIKSLDENGYDDSNPICVKKNNEIIDGQHRAVYLLKKYGEDHEVTVFKIYF